MAIQFACPNCGKGFNVKDELAGRKSKCPACTTVLVVPSAPGKSAAIQQYRPETPPPPSAAAHNPFAFDETAPTAPSQHQGPSPFQYEEPRSGANGTPALVGSPESWQGAHAGLRWLYFGTCLILGSIVFAFIASILLTIVFGVLGEIMMSIQNGDGFDEFWMGGGSWLGVTITLLVLGVFALLNLGGELMRIVGFIRMLGVPAESGAKTFGFLTLFCEVGSIGTYIGAYLVAIAAHVATRSSDTGPGVGAFLLVLALQGLCVVLLVLGLLFLLLYLRKVGQALNSKVLPGRAINVLVWFVVGPVAAVIAFVSYLILSAIMINLIRQGQDWPQGILFYGLIFTVVIEIAIPLTLMVKYLNVINLGAQEIRKRALRGVRT